MPKGQGYKFTKWKIEGQHWWKLPVWTTGSQLLLYFILEQISDSCLSHPFNNMFYLKNAFLLQRTLSRKLNNTLAIIQRRVGNSTRKQHPQTHSAWDTVSCWPESVSYQLYWRGREDDHCPNIGQVFLRAAETLTEPFFASYSENIF